MKKIFKFILLLLLQLYSVYGISQVGINTTTPKAILHIDSNINYNSGLIVPNVTKFPSTDPTKDQDGMLLFLENNLTDSMGYIDANKGFYYWDWSDSITGSDSTASIPASGIWIEQNDTIPDLTGFDLVAHAVINIGQFAGNGARGGTTPSFVSAYNFKTDPIVTTKQTSSDKIFKIYFKNPVKTGTNYSVFLQPISASTFSSVTSASNQTWAISADETETGFVIAIRNLASGVQKGLQYNVMVYTAP